MIWIVYTTTLIAIAIALYLYVELRQRDRHLKWVDERDQGMIHLFQKVAEARVVPMSNPLDGMKQHGMITKNAVTPFYLNEMDERLTYTQGFLRRAIASAKDLEAWERDNPAPPVSLWKSRKADVGSPVPTPAEKPQRTTPSGQPLPEKSGREETMKALGEKGGGLAIGKGAFGPEVDER